MGIGKNIKAITKNKGITLLELSKKSGVPINTIYTLTREDPKSATLRTLDRLAEALGVDSNMLRIDPEEFGEDRTSEYKALEKEKNRVNAILKVIQTLSYPEEKNWDHIEQLVAEARRLDEVD